MSFHRFPNMTLLSDRSRTGAGRQEATQARGALDAPEDPPKQTLCQVTFG
jgi:hypothetical protein